MEDVLRALQTLYTSPSNAAREEANVWLQAFQKEVCPSMSHDETPADVLQYDQPEAWETANVILASSDAPAEPKLFAAQTFRTKVSSSCRTTRAPPCRLQAASTQRLTCADCRVFPTDHLRFGSVACRAASPAQGYIGVCNPTSCYWAARRP